jgi:hypothetical protein
MNDPLNGSLPAFKEKWDSSSKHESPSTTNSGMQASEVILQALKTTRKAETAEWLQSLGLGPEAPATDNNNALEADNAHPNLLSSIINQTAVADQPASENTMIGQAISWLDKMFVQFELYAAEFNLNVRGTNLVVSCTRPIRRTNETGGLYSEETDASLSYAGHIATQLWALVVRGSTSKVAVFIIPAELLLAFSVSSSTESGYDPLLELDSDWRNNEIIWHIQGHVITVDQIPFLAKELFGDLIKVASGQASEAEVIANPLPSVISGENPIITLTTANTQTISPNNNILNPGTGSTSQVEILPPATVNIINNQTSLPKVKAAVQLNSSPHFSLESIKAAEQTISLIEQDISSLMESGKKALEVEDSATFEKIKVLTEKLETLKRSMSAALVSFN